MTSLLRLRLRRLYQLDKMPLAYPKREVGPGYLHSRHAVVVNPDNFTGQDDGIAYSGSVGVSRGFFSHLGYLGRVSGAARVNREVA